MVDNLNHLKRTGRLPNTANLVDSILRIKPILSMDVQNEGKISAIAKEGQYKRAYNYIKKGFSCLTFSMFYPTQLTIFHADDEEREAAQVNDYQMSFPKIKADQSIIGPIVGVRVDQHTMAMIWCRDLDSYSDKNGKPLLNINSQAVED